LRQFDVYPNPSTRSQGVAPFVLVLQSHFLIDAPTVVVAPMLIDDGLSAYGLISLEVEFNQGRYIVQLSELAALPPETLRRPVGDLRGYEDDIRRALDRLFTGF